MRGTEAVEFTNMCMVRDGERVLVQDRRDPRWPGLSFPGGHVEPGEAFTDAVIREVREETGLAIASPRLCGVKDWCDEGRRYMVLLYIADRFSGELCSSEEGEVRWMTIEDLKTQKLASDMDKLLEVFMEEDLSEFFYRREDGDWVTEIK